MASFLGSERSYKISTHTRPPASRRGSIRKESPLIILKPSSKDSEEHTRGGWRAGATKLTCETDVLGKLAGDFRGFVIHTFRQPNGRSAVLRLQLAHRAAGGHDTLPVM